MRERELFFRKKCPEKVILGKSNQKKTNSIFPFKKYSV